MHARNVASHPRARLVSVFDVDASAAASVASDLGVEVASRLCAGNLRETSVESWNDHHTAAQDVLLPFFMERYRAAYVAELDAFVAALESGGPMSPDFADGLAALLLAQAAARSAKTSRCEKPGSQGREPCSE